MNQELLEQRAAETFPYEPENLPDEVVNAIRIAYIQGIKEGYTEGYADALNIELSNEKE